MTNPFAKKKSAEKVAEGEGRLLAQAAINLDLASAAYSAIMGSLSQKYKLAEGDKVQLDGTIVRKPKDQEA